MFSNGKFKNIVAESDPNSSEICVKPGSIFHTTYTLQPQRGEFLNILLFVICVLRFNFLCMFYFFNIIFTYPSITEWNRYIFIILMYFEKLYIFHVSKANTVGFSL